MMLTLLHTAKVHEATFDALRDRIAPGAELRHVVRPRWLDRARAKGPEGLEPDVAALMAEADGPVLCTCSTLGPVAEALGAVRVDWPMMQAAAEAGGPILMAYALESTFEPSLTLLERALASVDRPAKVRPLPLERYWPLFEAGEAEAFAAVIATEVREAVKTHEIGCVVLAQVSMAPAAHLLADMPVPVFASPELALKAMLGLS